MNVLKTLFNVNLTPKWSKWLPPVLFWPLVTAYAIAAILLLGLCALVVPYRYWCTLEEDKR